jgi:hypothetical protein
MSSLNGPSTFADDGRSTIERTVEATAVKIDDIDNFYEIERTYQRILDGGYSRIALQFPDELLADSATVASKLRDRTGQSIFILADTSYGSCCVDEVAAEHVNADFIVHYGRSCLSPYDISLFIFTCYITPHTDFLMLGLLVCLFCMCLGGNRLMWRDVSANLREWLKTRKLRSLSCTMWFSRMQQVILEKIVISNIFYSC